MRTVFLFFLALNVLFFIWQSSSWNPSSRPSRASLTAIPANVSKLVLLKEKMPGQEEDSQTADNQPRLPAEVEAAANTRTVPLTVPLPPQKRGPGQYECFTLGPFKDSTLANPIALKLRDLGAITHERQHDKQLPTGYWVYIPSFKSWKDARQMVVKLEKRGVKDMFIMGRGTMQNAISAGLFTTSLAAENRQVQLKKLGADARVQTQFSSTPEFWIDIDVEAEKQQVISAIKAIAKGLTVLTLMPQKCGNN